MKLASTIARVLLGLMFVAFPIMFFTGKLPQPTIDPASPVGHFMAAFAPTGYMNVIEVLQLVSGVLLLSGKFVNLGLSILGPIVVNILLFHFLVSKGDYGVPIVVGVLTLVALLGRKDYVAVLTTP